MSLYRKVKGKMKEKLLKKIIGLLSKNGVPEETIAKVEEDLKSEPEETTEPEETPSADETEPASDESNGEEVSTPTPEDVEVQASEVPPTDVPPAEETPNEEIPEPTPVDETPSEVPPVEEPTPAPVETPAPQADPRLDEAITTIEELKGTVADLGGKLENVLNALKEGGILAEEGNVQTVGVDNPTAPALENGEETIEDITKRLNSKSRF